MVCNAAVNARFRHEQYRSQVRAADSTMCNDINLFSSPCLHAASTRCSFTHAVASCQTRSNCNRNAIAAMSHGRPSKLSWDQSAVSTHQLDQQGGAEAAESLDTARYSDPPIKARILHGKQTALQQARMVKPSAAQLRSLELS